MSQVISQQVAGSSTVDPTDIVISLSDVGKTYGHTVALDSASITVGRGELVAIAGHNGAGKTTLMKIIGGLVGRDKGTITFRGTELPTSYSPRDIRQRGLALALQEISLFPDLRVVEHVGVVQPDQVRNGWRNGAATALLAQLDDMFPSHGITPNALVSTLTLAQRQMLQIALSCLGTQPTLLILDEPTSSLTDNLAEELFDYLHRKRREDGLSIILISHKMTDILGHTDRTVVMRDGAMVSDRPTKDLTLDLIMRDMGEAHAEDSTTPTASRTPAATDGRTVLAVKDLSWRGLRGVDLEIRAGEVVGLAGLEANGQQEVLEAVWRARSRFKTALISRSVSIDGTVAYVSGDRQDQGLFPLWSVERNLTISTADKLAKAGVINQARERTESSSWIRQLAIKAEADTPVTALSGGNQQKILLARGLSRIPSLLILDDPFRGVDITTKVDAYQQLRQFAQRGSAILWYTSENTELLECDRAYVLFNKGVSAVLVGDQLTADRLIATSFGETE